VDLVQRKKLFCPVYWVTKQHEQEGFNQLGPVAKAFRAPRKLKKARQVLKVHAFSLFLGRPKGEERCLKNAFDTYTAIENNTRKAVLLNATKIDFKSKEMSYLQEEPTAF